MSRVRKDSAKIEETVPEYEGEEYEYSEEDLESERERQRRRRRSAIQGVLIFLTASAAVAVMLISTQLPVFQYYGTQMRPTMDSGDIVVCIKTEEFQRGELIAFDMNNKTLIRRVIGVSGDKISIDEDGVVTVNDEELQEPYIINRNLGKCNVKFPLTVPQGRVFVLGDTRDTAVDSRNSAVGCVDVELAEGKIVFRLWPAYGIGFM